MKFVCLGYFDESRWNDLSAAERDKLVEACFAYDDELRKGKHYLGGEALDSADNAVTLVMKNGAVEVIDGPFGETKELLGGILYLEANDLNHAIALMSRHPGVKIGPFEIRAADESINRELEARARKFNTVEEQTK